MTDTADSFYERETSYRKQYIDKLEYLGDSEILINRLREDFKLNRPKRNIEIHNMYSDTLWHKKALEELEQRKKVNVGILKVYGLDV